MPNTSLPEYTLNNETVKVVIEGKVLDINYASKLASLPNLTFEEVFLLDKVQKSKPLKDEEVKQLRRKKLIEGKRTHIYISSKVAKHTSQEDDYMRLKGIDDAYAKKIIIDYLKKFKKAQKSNFINVLIGKLPDSLTDKQKENKIKNYLQELRIEGLIAIEKKQWILKEK